MNEENLTTERFETIRPHLGSVAYRMLGSTSEADDAVQEAWIRLNRSDTSAVDNLDGWLTTVVARVCLDMLRSRKARREDPLEAHVPDPIVTRADFANPESEAMLADSVGLALLVVLERLAPAERLAFVLHDMFAVPFDEIAPIVGRTPDAARQLASRARRRVQGDAPIPDVDLGRQRAVVDAFFAAARDGDFDALVSLLDPDIVRVADAGPGAPGSTIVRGAAAVAGQALAYARPEAIATPALVNGSAGVVVTVDGKPYAVMGFTVVDGKVAEIDVLLDPDRLTGLDLAFALG